MGHSDCKCVQFDFVISVWINLLHVAIIKYFKCCVQGKVAICIVIHRLLLVKAIENATDAKCKWNFDSLISSFKLTYANIGFRSVNIHTQSITLTRLTAVLKSKVLSNASWLSYSLFPTVVALLQFPSKTLHECLKFTSTISVKP